ncbi:MAG: preprotein translocase subunit SecG [Thermoanaerobaculia bacterium]
MIYLVYTIHVITCLFLILVVLLQQGKGADLSVFGGGSTQAAFGARGAATFLHKMTVVGFIAFIFTTMSIGFLQSSGRQGSVMTTVEEEQTEPATETEAVPVPETTPAEAPAGDAAPVAEPVGEETDEPSVDESAEPPTG